VKNQVNQNGEHGVLETTAQAIGSTLGNLALKTGIAKATVETPEPVAVGQPGHQHENRKTRRAKKKK
jgi:hypothetical protein